MQVPAQQRVDEESWYRGTADAVYQNQDILASYGADYIVVLAGDHIYKMNYALMLADHVSKGRDCTVGCIAVPRAEAVAFGVMAVDANHMITEFVEKPADPPPMPGDPNRSLASMGIYIFNARFLYKELERDINDPSSSHDFGKDIIPRAVKNGNAAAHPFELSAVGTRRNEEPYWRDVGTIDAYWDANIDLTATDPKLNLYDTRWPIWTYQAQLPPAKFVHDQTDRRGIAVESLVSGGCIVSGWVHRSVLFSSVRVHSYSNVNWSVLLPEVQIGRRARISRCVSTESTRGFGVTSIEEGGIPVTPGTIFRIGSGSGHVDATIDEADVVPDHRLIAIGVGGPAFVASGEGAGHGMRGGANRQHSSKQQWGADNTQHGTLQAFHR